MKVIWIGALLSLLVFVVYDRANPGSGAERPVAAARSPLIANAEAESKKPSVPVVRAGAAGAQRTLGPASGPADIPADSAMTPSEYVLLHQTRYESMPPADGALRAPVLN